MDETERGDREREMLSMMQKRRGSWLGSLRMRVREMHNDEKQGKAQRVGEGVGSQSALLLS